MNKIIKTGLIACSIIPIATNAIPVSASEVDANSKNMPSIDKVYTIIFGTETYTLKPGDTIPNPTYTGTVPSGKEFSGWQNDKYSVGQTLPALSGTSETIVFQATFSDVSNPQPQPPTSQPQPVITHDYLFNSTHQNIMVKESEVGNVDYLQLAKATILKTTITKSDGVVTNTKTEPVTPVVTNSTVQAKSGQYFVEFNGTGNDLLPNPGKVIVTVVPNNTVIDDDRALGILINNPQISITASEAQKITSGEELVKLNGVVAFNNASYETVAVINNESLLSINSGKPGVYTIKYGILRGRANPLVAEASIEVKAEPGVTEQNPTPIPGVEESKVAGRTGNAQIVENSGSTTNKGVRTSANSIVLATTLTLFASIVTLITIKRRNK